MRYRTFAVLAGTLALLATPAHAQYGRFEIVPQFGYTWGGSRGFDRFTTGGQNFPGGAFVIEDSPSYGVTLGFEGRRGSYFTLMYQRQDTDLRLDWNQTPPAGQGARASFATNAVVFGFRQEFARSRAQRFVPYIGGGLGFNVLDVKEPGIGSHTDFLLSPHGGFRYMFGNGTDPSRFGLQVDLRGLFTFVPSGDVGIYCDWWGFCYAYESSAVVSQGTISAGVVLKF